MRAVAGPGQRRGSGSGRDAPRSSASFLVRPGRPVRTAPERRNGRSHPSARRAGVAVTAAEPDAAVPAEPREHGPTDAGTERAASEDRRPGTRQGLVHATATLHRTEPGARGHASPRRRSPAACSPRSAGAAAAGRWPRRPRAGWARRFRRVLRSPPRTRRHVPDPRWGYGTRTVTVVHRSAVVGRRYAMSGSGHAGRLPTVSACPLPPSPARAEVFSRAGRVLPEGAGVTAGRTLRPAVRRRDRQPSGTGERGRPPHAAVPSGTGAGRPTRPAPARPYGRTPSLPRVRPPPPHGAPPGSRAAGSDQARLRRVRATAPPPAASRRTAPPAR